MQTGPIPDASRILKVAFGEISWSPTGERIVFTAKEDGRQQIYRVDFDGGNLINISNSQANDFAPDWGPVIEQ